MFLGRNSSLDLEVVKFVFNEDTELYRWRLPHFSEDRNLSAAINTEMAFKESAIREKYEKELERRAIELGWKSKPEFSGIAMFLCVILPEEICKAAIMACRKSKVEAIP